MKILLSSAALVDSMKMMAAPLISVAALKILMAARVMSSAALVEDSRPHLFSVHGLLTLKNRLIPGRSRMILGLTC